VRATGDGWSRVDANTYPNQPLYATGSATRYGFTLASSLCV